MSDIKFNCPHCGQHLIVDAVGAGSTVACPICARTITISRLVKQKALARTKWWLLLSGIAAVIMFVACFLVWQTCQRPSVEAETAPAAAKTAKLAGSPPPSKTAVEKQIARTVPAATADSSAKENEASQKKSGNGASTEAALTENNKGWFADVGVIVPDGVGVNIHFTAPRPGELEMLAAAGFRWVRMDFVWEATEKERGKYNFDDYDRLLNALEAQKLRAMFILDYENRLYEPRRGVTTEEGRQAYARWAAAAAAHFKGHRVIWEIWNEPNIPGFWQPQPSAEAYSALALAASKGIREAAPGEVIIGPAPSGLDLKFLESCFKAGVLKWWDAVSVHPYRGDGPEGVENDYGKLRSLIAQYAPPGRVIPIVSGEWGYSSAWQNFNDIKQCQMLTRQLLVNLANNIPLSIWYDWHDDGTDPKEGEHHFGVVNFEYLAGQNPVYKPKPSYMAVQTLTSVLDGFKFHKRLALGDPADYALLFTKGDDFRLVLWTTTVTAHGVKLSWQTDDFEVFTCAGKRLSPASARGGSLVLVVGESPLFLIPKRTIPRASYGVPSVTTVAGNAVSSNIGFMRRQQGQISTNNMWRNCAYGPKIIA